MIPSVSVIKPFAPLLAQQGGGAYQAGQIVGIIFLVVLVGAILWKYLKKERLSLSNRNRTGGPMASKEMKTSEFDHDLLWPTCSYWEGPQVRGCWVVDLLLGKS